MLTYYYVRSAFSAFISYYLPRSTNFLFCGRLIQKFRDKNFSRVLICTLKNFFPHFLLYALHIGIL